MDSKEVLHNQHLIIAITTLIEVLGITSYVLRLLARRFSNTALWWDDYVMGIGLVMIYPPSLQACHSVSCSQMQLFASLPGLCYYAGKSKRPTADQIFAEKSSSSIRARKTC